MAKMEKKAATKKSKVKSSTKKPAKKKVVVKKPAKKTSSVKAAKKTAQAFVSAVGRKTTAAKKSSKKLVIRAIKAIMDIAAPVIPGSDSKS